MNLTTRRLLFDLPSCYRVRVRGPLNLAEADRLGDVTIRVHHATSRQQVTTLTCEVRDQAALMGVLNMLYDMGLPLLKVERLGPRLPADDRNRVVSTSE